MSTSVSIPKPISSPDATLGPDDRTQCLKRGVDTVSFLSLTATVTEPREL